METAGAFMRNLRAGRSFNGGGVKGWFIASWVLSLVFHPLLIPAYSAALLLRYAADFLPLSVSGKWGFLVFIFCSTCLLPAAGIGILRVAGLIKSLSMAERRDRHLPHFIAFLSYLGVAYLLNHFLPVPGLPFYLMLASALSVGITGLITLFWKISSHLAGMGGLLGFQMALAVCLQSSELVLPVFLSTLFSGAVYSARLYLKAHDHAQLLAGFFLGMVISSFTVTFFTGFF